MTTKTADLAGLSDINYMRAALALARRGLGSVWPNPSVGCVLVRDDLEGRVVGRGWTQPGGRPHAETEALRRAGGDAADATAYISLEPCDHHGQTPPCSEALAAAGVRRAVVALRDCDPRVSGKGIARLQSHGIEVVEGVLEDDARRLNQGFIQRLTERRPLFSLKLATDREGRIPAPGADEKWITAPLARQRGHLLRARHDAVLFGIGTVLDDDPRYTCRLPGMEAESPVRVLLDSQLRLPLDSKLLQTLEDSPLWVIVGSGFDISRAAALRLNSKNFEIIAAKKVDENGRPQPRWVADELARRGLTRVLVEAGPKVSAAFLDAVLVDRIYWFRAQQDLGAEGVPVVPEFDVREYSQTDVLDMGADSLETYNLGN